MTTSSIAPKVVFYPTIGSCIKLYLSTVIHKERGKKTSAVIRTRSRSDQVVTLGWALTLLPRSWVISWLPSRYLWLLYDVWNPVVKTGLLLCHGPTYKQRCAPQICRPMSKVVLCKVHIAYINVVVKYLLKFFRVPPIRIAPNCHEFIFLGPVTDHG